MYCSRYAGTRAHHSTHHIAKRINAEWSIDQHRYSMWHASDGLLQWMHDGACCTEDDVCGEVTAEVLQQR